MNIRQRKGNQMDFKELIRNRYSVRAYKPDPLEKAVLEEILGAGRLAPTASNRQPFRILVIPTEGKKEELRRIYHREWFSQAPLVLGVCGVAKEAWVRQADGMSYLYVDAAIVMDHIILAAANLGIGTCWVANFNLQAARELLRLPEEVTPIAFTPLGYADDKPKEKTRRPLQDLVQYFEW